MEEGAGLSEAMDEDYETDQLLSDCGEEGPDGEQGGKTPSTTSSSRARQAPEAVLRNDENGTPFESEGGGKKGSYDLDQQLVSRASEKRVVSLCRALNNKWVVKETITLFRLALPLFFMNFLVQSPIFIALLFVGQFSGSQELSATALGTTFVNVTGFSVIIGLSTAADTLCPQSYGYKNYKRVGVVVQRGLLIIGLVCMPVVAVWMNAETILLWLKQLPCVVRLTGQYLRIFIVALPALLIYTMLQKFLQAQSVIWVFLIAGILVNISVAACSAVLIAGVKLGTIGAGLSIAFSLYLAPAFLLVYIKCRGLHRQTWGGWSFESLTEWWQFLRLGIPGFLMLAFEWWSFEISAIVVGTINETELAINTVLIQCGTILYMIPYSIAVAVNIRVGNELGAGNPVGAKRVSYIGVLAGVVNAVVISALMLIFRNQIGRIFTSEQVVSYGVGDAMFGAVGIIFFDSVQGVISGIMRATGRQAKAALVNFCCYYLIGLPLGISLALPVGLNTKGMWIGLSVADGIQTAILTVLFLTTNWKKESDKAVKNSGSAVSVDSDTTETLSQEEGEGEGNKESSISDGVLDSGIDLEAGEEGEGQEREEGEGGTEREESEGVEDADFIGMAELGDEDVTVSYTVTERLVLDETPPQTTPPGRLYVSSNKYCCTTKTSIITSRALFLLVGVAFLMGGVVMAAIVRHHPDGCMDTNITNCTLTCLDMPPPTVLPTPTDHKGTSTAAPVIITPTTLLFAGTGEADDITTPPNVDSTQDLLCQCDESEDIEYTTVPG